MTKRYYIPAGPVTSTVHIPATSHYNACLIFQSIQAGTIPRLRHYSSQARAQEKADALNLLHGRTFGDVPYKVFSFAEVMREPAPPPAWPLDRTADTFAALALVIGGCFLAGWSTLL